MFLILERFEMCFSVSTDLRCGSRFRKASNVVLTFDVFDVVFSFPMS